jgi:hypothetical protein
MKTISIILLALLCSSCTLLPKRTSFEFPQDLSGMARHEMNQAKTCIESKGLKLNHTARRLTVQKVPGQRKFREGWAWQEPTLNNVWVLGLCWDRGSSYLIQVGANPNNMAEVSPQIMKHEMGHYWLMSNYRIYTHDRRFHSCFVNWVDAQVRTTSITLEDGSIVVIDYVVE